LAAGAPVPTIPQHPVGAPGPSHLGTGEGLNRQPSSGAGNWPTHRGIRNCAPSGYPLGRRPSRDEQAFVDGAKIEVSS